MLKKNYDVFISYSRRDSAIADKIIHALNAGDFSYFNLQNSDFLQSIANAIDRSKLFLCVLSENAYASPYVMYELKYALYRQDIIVLPVIVDNSQLPDEIRFDLAHLNINILAWHFEGSHYNEDIIIKDVSRALGFNKHVSKEEKEQNIEKARDRQEGVADYSPKETDIDIFISYRRIDGRDYARNMMQALKINGYSKIFFDYNSLRDGIFNTQIIDAIYSCKDFILVISPLALKNCAKKGDWVAKEIRTALKYNKHIIPVVIEDTFKEWPNDFPKDLSSIKDIQFNKLMTDEYFEDSIEKLKTRLTTIASETGNFSLLQATSIPMQPTQETVIYKIKVNKKCRLLIDDEEIQVLEASILTKIPLPKGEYIRKIVDYEDESVSKEDVLQLDHERAELIYMS